MDTTQTLYVTTVAGPKSFVLTPEAVETYLGHAREIGALVDSAQLGHHISEGGVLKIGIEMDGNESEDPLFVTLVSMSPSFWLMVGDAGSTLGYGNEDPQIIDLTAASDPN